MSDKNLTTEQLAAKTLQDVKQMSPTEKAEARKQTTALIKRPEPQPDCDREYVDRMWELFLRCNATRQPDADGAYIIVDEIGETRPKNWERLTPYSLAQKAAR
jgi:hypothetical protein